MSKQNNMEQKSIELQLSLFYVGYPLVGMGITFKWPKTWD